MKWMVMGVLAFGVSSAAAAGFVAMQSSEETPATEEVAVAEDTSQVEAETPNHDEQKPEEQPADAQDDSTEVSADTVGAEVESELPVAVTSNPDADTDCPAVVASPPEVVTTAEPAKPDPEAQRQASRQVARILSNMRDQDMAQVLAELEDDEVEMILRNVTARDAARILSQLSGERAAQMSRRLLTTTPASGSSNR